MSERGINLIFRDPRVQNRSQCSRMGGEFQITESSWESRLLTSFQILKCMIHPYSQPQVSVMPPYLGLRHRPLYHLFSVSGRLIFSWSFVLLVPTYSSGYDVSITTLLYTKVKVKVAQSCLILICLYIQKVNVTRYSDSESRWVVSDSLWPYGLYSPWNSPGQNTGVGSLFLLQGIFPTQRLNPGLPQHKQILYQLGHKGSPRILEWVAYPFSSRSSWSRNWIGVSCIAGGFFNNWAIREAWAFRLYATPYLKDWVRGSVLLPVLTSLWVLSHHMLIVGCLVLYPLYEIYAC